ncbi:MAG: GrpB family protein [Bacteriovorax sp.]|nr:GrpB family protein [Bacteriovorax sp.]
MTINLFESCDIGLKRGSIVLAPHSINWATAYSFECSRIYEVMSAYLPQLKLHHIGSTAIKAIVAKPVIDILGEVDVISSVDQFEQIFKNLGYEYKGEYGIHGRRYLTLYSLNKEIAYVHLHIFENGSKEFTSHLRFRDVLNKNEELRLEYEALKLFLVESKIPRSEYSRAKADLINKILNSSEI